MWSRACAEPRGVRLLTTLFHEARRELAGLRQTEACVAELRSRLSRYEPFNGSPEAGSEESGPRELQRLQQEVKEREEELVRLRQQPEHQKDLEIQQLRRALHEQQRVQATRTVLCDSLAEEAGRLRAQLGATVQVCQELLRRMEKGKRASLESQTESLSEAGGCSEAKLRAENQELRQRVAYVESLNAKWQKYDSSREEYVRGLYHQRREAGDGTLLQQEIFRLNVLLQERMASFAMLEEARRKDCERIQMLEQQVLIYAEDFKSERADRERAQSRIQDLQEELTCLRKQLHIQQGSKPLSEQRVSSRTHTQSAEPLQRSSNKPTARTQAHTHAHNELHCPQCGAAFDDDHMAECLNHLEECVRI